MPADPATQFQAPSIMSGYNYQPVKGGDLGGSHLFGGAGELWAGVGKTALAAASQFGDTAKMIQASPLNPAVAAQQAYQETQYDTAADRINELQGTRAGRMTMGTGPEGLTTVPAARTDIDPMIRLALRSAPKKEEPPPPPPPAPGPEEKPKTPQEQGQDDFKQHPENYYQNPSTGNYERRQDAPPLETTPQPPKKTHTTGDELTDNRSASAANYAGPSQADVNAGVAEALSRNRFASSEQGVPADYQPPQPGGGSIWSPMRPAPMAPPAPGAPPPAQSQTPAAATQADQAAMQAWQNQTQTEPMTAQDAMSWIKRKTTLAQDATYLPHGGPGGEPAYAFHMKGGGVNTVPISQMVKDGGGPIVAAQNTSQVLSQSDRIQQQDPGAQGQPPAPQTPPPDQPQIAQGGPPAAPVGPLPGAQGQPPAPQGPPAAPGAYDPTPYRQAVAQAVANPQNLTADTAAGGQPAAAPLAGPQITDPTDFNANVRGYSQDQLNKMTKDPDLGEYGGFNWRQDRTYGGKYAVMRDGSNPITKELRWNAGLGEWVPTYKENGQLMEQLMAARAKVPLMNGMLSDTDIANMSAEDLKTTLDEAVRLDKTGGDASDQNSLHIRGGINQSRSLARLIKIMEDAQKAGISPKEYSTVAQDQSKGAADRDAIMPEGPPKNPIDLLRRGVAQLHDWEADGGGTHPLADAVKREAEYFGQQMAQTPGLEYTTGEKPENKTFTVYVGRVPIQVPIGRDTSSIQEVNRVFSNPKNPQDVIDALKTVKARTDDDIMDSVDRATKMSWRTPSQFKKAVSNLQNKQNIDDPTPQYKVTNPNTPTTSTAGPTPGPTPPLQFDSVDDATKFARNAKSGTFYDVKDSQGKIHHMRVD